MFQSKKGMSPLIATVLLIAFAVAMGAMIMNWSAGIEAGDDPSSMACDKISISTDKGACYASNKLSFKLTNDGVDRVYGVKLSSLADGNAIDITIKDTQMIQGETITKDVPYLYSGGSVDLEFIPLVQVAGEIVECRSGGFAQSELPNC